MTTRWRVEKKRAARIAKLFKVEGGDVTINMSCRLCGSPLIGAGQISKHLVSLQVDPCSSCKDPSWLPELQADVRKILVTEVTKAFNRLKRKERRR